jgi:hypothetical protein
MRQAIQSGPWLFPAGSHFITFDFAIVHTSLGKPFNAMVAVDGIPFRFNNHKGTLDLYLNIFDVTHPNACQIEIEAIRCPTLGLASFNVFKPKLLKHLQTEWRKG